jgi:hypothetical protein
MDDLSKLPKWAQNRIGKLERDVEYYKKQLDQTDAGQSKVCWGDYESKHGIPEGATVTYHLQKGEMWLELKGDEVKVTAPTGTHRLTVRPKSGNVLTLTVE